MSSYLNGRSLITGIQTGMQSSFAILSGLYKDGITQQNLVESMGNSDFLRATGTMGTTFASYLSQNFGTLDKNSDGIIGADEMQQQLSLMSSQGLTRQQITQLGAMSGISADMQSEILNHFTEIDTNHDGKVSSGEIQAYNLTSKKEQRRVEDENNMIKNTSIFYGDEDKEFSSSLLSYKWINEGK